MKALYIIVLALVLTSCKKEETKPTCPIKFYTRVECVEPDGTSTYSTIVVTTVNQ